MSLKQHTLHANLIKSPPSSFRYMNCPAVKMNHRVVLVVHMGWTLVRYLRHEEKKEKGEKERKWGIKKENGRERKKDQ
jgi:hypothetical protein